MGAGDRAELAERWRAEARDYHYNGDQIYAMALSRSQERSSPIERGILAVSSAIRDSRDRLIDYLRRPEDPLVVSGDRKSVVKGKSVSVRVDLGGRRIIKKKNNNQIKHNIII